MRLVSFSREDGLVRCGVLVGDDAVIDARTALARLPELPIALSIWTGSAPSPSDMTGFLAGGGHELAPLKQLCSRPPSDLIIALDGLHLHAPVPRPGKIVGIGRNYGAHVRESAFRIAPQPRIFLKSPHSVVGPGDPVCRPSGVAKLDWEAELAVVIGRRAKDVSPGEAARCIAGYVPLNDISAREFQFDIDPAQTSFAKSMDTFCPMGPAIVTADDLPDPTTLEIRCFLNGALVQDGNTSDMIFPTLDLVAYVSRYMTLEPGDIIATGTPAGVGHFRTPPLYLVDGDEIRVEIGGLGVLANRIRDAATPMAVAT